MQAVTGIFTSFEPARRSVEELNARGFSQERINLLAPGSSAAELENIPSTEGEQPGMGKAVGGVGSYAQVEPYLRSLHPAIYKNEAFRRGYERGQEYCRRITEAAPPGSGDQGRG